MSTKPTDLTEPGIAIVVAYLGTPPFWLPAFVVSCARNPTITWVLYTDFDMFDELPANVIHRRTSARELEARASDVLHVSTALLRTPRKLNDLKPAYGLLFADALAPFDFWAYSDLDVVWGDVRRFVDATCLTQSDIVSSRAGRLSGHFTLFRNDLATNRLFEDIPGVREALTSPTPVALDERVFTAHLKTRLCASANGWPRMSWKRELTTNAAYQRALGTGPAGRLWWRDGRTFNAEGDELMYLHFHKLKPYMQSINFGTADRPFAFAVDRHGFTA